MKRFVIRDKSKLRDVFKIIYRAAQEFINNKAIEVTIKYAESKHSAEQSSERKCGPCSPMYRSRLNGL